MLLITLFGNTNNMSWAEVGIIAYRTIFLYFFLLFILRLMGKREIGNLSSFDIVVFFVISELFSLSLNDLSNSILHSILPILIIVTLQIATAFLSLKSKKIREVAEGKQTYIIYKGKIDINAMKKERYSIDDLMSQIYQKGYSSPREIDYAILDDTGKLLIIKKSSDIQYVEPLIQDGKFNEKFIKNNNISKEYIYSEMMKQGYTDVEDIFFAQALEDEFYIVPFKECIKEDNI